MVQERAGADELMTASTRARFKFKNCFIQDARYTLSQLEQCISRAIHDIDYVSSTPLAIYTLTINKPYKAFETTLHVRQMLRSEVKTFENSISVTGKH